jgi:hypothetical protein
MSTRNHESIQLGTLVAAAYDRAASVTSNPDRAAELATVIVTQWLLEHGERDLLRQLAGQVESRRTPVRARTASAAALPRSSRRSSKRVAHALAA